MLFFKVFPMTKEYPILSLQAVFQITPLTLEEWMAVLKFSFPVILLDETLKFIARKFTDGKNPLYTIYWMLGVWVLYIALAINSPI